MSSPQAPSTMRAMQISSSAGGIEKNLHINASAPIPKRKPDQHLVEVIATALNPVDYKPVEAPLVTRYLLSKPHTPVIDYVGKIVQPADGSSLQPGQIVFGGASVHVLGGALAEYTTSKKTSVAPLPEGLDPVWGATVCVAGLTAYQSISPCVKEGDSVFLNGGSGGTGVFGIQIAKAKGCHVTTTCSTPNVELCKSLGADEVIDYKKSNVLQALIASGRKYDHVVDNVSGQPELYFKMHEYTRPGAVWVQVGAKVTLTGLKQITSMMLLPGFLGGGKRKFQFFATDQKTEDLAQIGAWMKSGQVKPIIDSKFKFEDAPRAFERLKTDRARGKIVVEVATESS
ncbi:Zinc-type alcohol dehydrogenase [Lecanosticta acicola]|uniref:Zinc-type alcohol dehydrogenase n=1 Tax=Lecanosticta acicola TaxID=111012 RepID=A0AAI8Z0I9_9PEZI|nr:Zinc-type alcohol dehydrogenase [Lecanosticta acicola]